MKTGSTESYSRIPTQLMTLLKCLPDYFIYSDKDQHIAGHHIRDSLDSVLPTTRIGNSDFDLYDRQQLCAVDQQRCNSVSTKSNEGWNLDKYKNVHIAEKVFKQRPNYDWYLFIDADTYVLFPTLMQWLPRMDHTKPHYIGSVSLLHNLPFAHGGSGYLVSRPVMEKLAAHGRIANELEEQTKHECCGDFMFSRAVNITSGTKVQNVVSDSRRLEFLGF
jgi:hypothetical protein